MTLDSLDPLKLTPAVLAVLVFAFAWLTFYHLGRRPLIDFDEAIYAQVASEALQNHTPLDFTWIGNLANHGPGRFFDKPPLLIWLTEVSYHMFGINEFAARFWPAIFAVLALPLTFIFVRSLSQSATAAILSVGAYFVAFQFSNFAGELQMDIPVGFCVLLALFGFWRAQENGRFYLELIRK
jgi:4-amino-4-deoxy-L-arabinose transferase-like glycosyltransferase